MRLLLALALAVGRVCAEPAREYHPRDLKKDRCPGLGQFFLDHVDAPNPMLCAESTGAFGRLLRGGKPLTPEAMACLKNLGITAIVDLRDVARETKSGDLDEKAEAEKLGLAYLNAPMHTTHDTLADGCGNTPARVSDANLAAARRASDFIATQLSDANGKVYVHCARGEDRTGFALMFLRATADACGKKTAHAEAAGYGYTPYCALENAWAKVPEPKPAR